ncbi:MAG: DUF5660 domain-containing protein [bacterium]|nr:DUF5660 domain-containing protein [bacterium]
MQTKGQSSKQKVISSDSLLEALRGFGGGTTKTFEQDFFKKLPEDFLKQSGLRPQNKQNPQSEESMYQEETDEWQSKLRQSETIRHQEKLVFSSRDQETKKQVIVLLQEVKKLAGAVENLDQKIQVAVIQAPVDPGLYHVNFFERLISFIKILTKKVEDAAVWSSASTAKGKKRSHYWGKVKDSGTKFLLSQERYMATQAG